MEQKPYHSRHCNIIATATVLPGDVISTTDILSNLSDKMTDELQASINRLGVNNRHSVIHDYPHFLTGKIERKLITNTTDLGIEATRNCLTSLNIDTSQIGLLITITNTANRHLPCFGYEVAGKLHDLIPAHVNIVNMQNQGCAVLLKAVEIAQYYLQDAANKNKYVVIVAAESHTGFFPPLTEKKYYGFREIIKRGSDAQELMNTMTLTEASLFGDGAIAFLLGKNADSPVLGSIAHLTDIEETDIDVIHMDEGGVLMPTYKGYPHYIMSANIPRRGAVYVEKDVQLLFEQQDVLFHSVDQADLYFIHTGSKKILDNICNKLQIDPTSEKVAYSYEILRHYGNLSSASVGFMIDRCMKEKKLGKGLIISFGVGFSSSSGFVQFT